MRSGAGINHYQSKKRRSMQLSKKRWHVASKTESLLVKQYLHH